MNDDTYQVREFYEYEDDYLEDDDVFYAEEYQPPDPAWHRADERWNVPWYQSWVALLVMIIAYLSITILIYWVEPGIR